MDKNNKMYYEMEDNPYYQNLIKKEKNDSITDKAKNFLKQHGGKLAALAGAAALAGGAYYLGKHADTHVPANHNDAQKPVSHAGAQVSVHPKHQIASLDKSLKTIQHDPESKQQLDNLNAQLQEQMKHAKTNEERTRILDTYNQKYNRIYKNAVDAQKPSMAQKIFSSTPIGYAVNNYIDFWHKVLTGKYKE